MAEFDLFGDNGYGKITGDTNLLASFTRLVNIAEDELEIEALKVDATWQFDDSSLTNYPIGYTNLVLGQRDYTFDVGMLKIVRVRIKDSSGNWVTLTGLDIVNSEYPYYFDNPTSGTPRFYDKAANSLFFDALPSYNSALGIEVTFQRQMNRFASTDTTAVPGIVSIFHPLLVQLAEYKYAFSRNLPVAKTLAVEIEKGKANFRDFYANRSRDERMIINKGYGERYS